MGIFRLPVEATRVVIRPPAGADDLRLLEAGRPDLRAALALLEGLVQRLDGAPIDGTALPITDVDALLLRLRQEVVGDLIRTDTRCPACRARIDLSFSIGDYLEHHRPAGSPDVVPAGELGWYRLAGADVELRVPSAGDQLAIAWEEDPERALLERCVRAAELTEDLRARVEAALEAIAPSLCGDLETTCPECGATVEVRFDPLQYTLRELRDRAAGLYDEVAWIAHHYHWSEAEILALPAARRARYAELAVEHARPWRSS